MRSSSWFVFFYSSVPWNLASKSTLWRNAFGTTILVQNLETLVFVSPSPMLIWALQRSQYFKIRVAQHWGRRGHITVRTTICDEYCSLNYLSQIYAYHNPLTPNITNINVLLTMPIHSRRQMDIELIKWMLWSFIKPSPLISKEG